MLSISATIKEGFLVSAFDAVLEARYIVLSTGIELLLVILNVSIFDIILLFCIDIHACEHIKPQTFATQVTFFLAKERGEINNKLKIPIRLNDKKSSHNSLSSHERKEGGNQREVENATAPTAQINNQQ